MRRGKATNLIVAAVLLLLVAAGPKGFTGLLASGVTGAITHNAAEHLANQMAAGYGWTGRQVTCLDWLWTRESGFDVTATNGQSGAYGIPQSLPADKMAVAGPDWQTSASTQISWGLGYIKATYRSPCNAWSHEEAVSWY
jgi:hypothetical protein